MSRRFAVAVVTLASIVAAAATADEAYLLDLEGVVGASVRPPAAATLAASPVLRLVWVDPTGIGVGAEAAALAEARSLLRKMGATVSWRRGDASELARPGEVRVILLDRTATSFGKAVLGATPPRFEVAPFVWVHVPSVRGVIGLDPRGSVFALSPAASRALAIALGRVVAHELVHALAPSVPHGTGLMSATLTTRQL
ncbi:MAG TPA: hypothetical protein VE359_22365, partial [Vicinamibacteria bacterium]|nr:hypothetical protein [Vicinamibacteria bacterium]